MPENGLKPAIAAAALLGVAGAGVVLSHLHPDGTLRLARAFAAADRSAGWAGWCAAAGLELLIALSGIVPASMIAVAAGMIYGTAGGFLACGPALLLGAVLAFRLSRSVFRGRVASLVARDRRASGLDRALARDGWRVVFLLRLSPVMPFALTSYALGLTSVGLGGYCLGTLASLPPLLLYTWIGSFARSGVASLSAGDHLVRLAVPALSLAGTAALVVYGGRLAGRVLREGGAPGARGAGDDATRPRDMGPPVR